jgi:hypothetical protein
MVGLVELDAEERSQSDRVGRVENRIVLLAVWWEEECGKNN